MVGSLFLSLLVISLHTQRRLDPIWRPVVRLNKLTFILTLVIQALLTNLAGKVSSAKEVLMALLEQLDQFKSSLAVTRLLPALGISLLRIKERTMSHSWAWALSTLRCHFSTVSVPANRYFYGFGHIINTEYDN